MNKRYSEIFRTAVTGCLLLLLLQPAQAGIQPSATRIIFVQGIQERSLLLKNANDHPILVQSWVDDGRGDPQTEQIPFVTLPSIFRMEPGASQGLRIVYNKDPLPQDRESVFWLNLFEIPPGTDSDEQNRITLIMNTQLKIFYRPSGLPSGPDKVAEALLFTLSNEENSFILTCRNPTPYHASFTTLELSLEGKNYTAIPEADMMTPPFAQKRYRLAPAGPSATSAGTRVRFYLVNDSGHPQATETKLTD